MAKPRRRGDSLGSLDAPSIPLIPRSPSPFEPSSVQAILKKLEDDRKAYQESLNRTHELLTQVLSAQVAGNGTLAASAKVPSITSSPSPRLRPTNPPASPPPTQERRGTGTTLDTFITLNDGRPQNPSTLSAEDESDTDEDEALYVQDPLPPQSHHEEGLKEHIREHKWTETGKKILGNLLERDDSWHTKHVFPNHQGPVEDRSHLSHYSIFDVGNDGAPLHLEFAADQVPLSRARDIWRRVNHVNADTNRSKKAVGRITIVREPSPLLFAALHYTLKDHFDMDEIFGLLISDKTKAIPHRPWDNDVRHRKTFIFTFEYFTMIGEECAPMKWQRADEELGVSETHIPITRCAAVIGLSLEGKPMKRIKHRGRRSDIARKEGEIYDPFSPWHVLGITAYPDWRSSVTSHDSTKHYVNGPEAFLITLRAEFRDAQKRLMDVYYRISDLVTTPADFMFKRDIRDKLLFEDDQYTYSRRYFWAYQSLAIMNEDIKEMRIAYQEDFDDKFWNGTNRIIWPSDDSQRHVHWRKRMKGLRQDIEKEIRGLEDIDRLNDEKMKEIKALRENLFSGTSVMESREAIRQQSVAVLQGHNIKVLTLVTIFFLPLTFVTSVFGMTNMNPNEGFVRFGIVTVVICLPTYMLIGSLGSESGFNFWKRHTKMLFEKRFYKKKLAALLDIFGYRPKWVQMQTISPKEIAYERPSKYPRSQTALDALAARGSLGPGGTLPMSPASTYERHTSIRFEPRSPTSLPSSPIANGYHHPPGLSDKDKVPKSLQDKPAATGQTNEQIERDDRVTWRARLFGGKTVGPRDDEKVMA